MVQRTIVNEHGEKFNITLLTNDIGIMNGSETSYEDVYLVNGWANHFIFGPNEFQQIKLLFDSPKIYNMILSDKSTMMMEEGKCICPLCLNVCEEEYELHHVIPAFQGGSDSPKNIIRLCLNCHALETRGNEQVRYGSFHALVNLMCYYHRVDFFTCQTEGNYRYKNRKLTNEYILAILNLFDNNNASNNLFDEINLITGISFRDSFLYKFHYFRHVFTGNIPWSYIKEVKNG